MSNIAITEDFNSSVIPASHKELLRDLVLKNNAKLNGCGYGNNIFIEAGNISVENGLFAYNELSVNLQNKSSECTIYSNIYSQNSVLVSVKSGGILRIYGSIIAEDINITNSIVYGSILGSRVNLENTIVLGNVVTYERLNAKRSLLGSFFGVDVNLKNHIYLIEPYGLAKNNITLSSPIGCYTLNSRVQELSKYFLTNDDINEISGFEEENPDAVYKVLSASNRYLNPSIISKRLSLIEDEYESLFDAMENRDLANIIELEKPFWDIINE